MTRSGFSYFFSSFPAACRSGRAWIVGAAIVIGLSMTGGCANDPTQGYSSESIFRADVATVSVPIFENTTFHRQVELDLTESIVKEIERRTPYKVTNQRRADTILTGTIRRVELDQLTRSRQTGLAEEMVLSVTVDFEWRDLRTNRLLVRRESFTSHGLFVPSGPTGEPIELGQLATVQKMARDIVDEMQSEW